MKSWSILESGTNTGTVSRSTSCQQGFVPSCQQV